MTNHLTRKTLNQFGYIAGIFLFVFVTGCTAKKPLEKVDVSSYSGIDDFLAKRTQDYLLPEVYKINGNTYYSYQTQNRTYTIFREDIKKYCAALGGKIEHRHYTKVRKRELFNTKSDAPLKNAISDLLKYSQKVTRNVSGSPYSVKKAPFPFPQKIYPDTFPRSQGINQFMLIINAFEQNAVGQFRCKKGDDTIWTVGNVIFYTEQPKRSNPYSLDRSMPRVKFLGHAVFVE